jgi:transcriptional regulator with XRE-family HTH domain
MITQKDIGGRLKIIRMRLGLKQSEMAKLLGLKQAASIAGYENGDNWPSAETLIKIAEAGSVTYDWLFLGFDSSQNLSIEEMELLADFKLLDVAAQKIITELITLLAKK